jgi:hypothetical protein
LVRDICPLWQIDDLQDTAQVVASELAGITARAAVDRPDRIMDRPLVA